MNVVTANLISVGALLVIGHCVLIYAALIGSSMTEEQAERVFDAQRHHDRNLKEKSRMNIEIGKVYRIKNIIELGWLGNIDSDGCMKLQGRTINPLFYVFMYRHMVGRITQKITNDYYTIVFPDGATEAVPAWLLIGCETGQEA